MYQKMHATFKKPKKLDDDELAEDKYFDEEGGSHQQAQNDNNDDEVDPLDLFMQGLESAGKEAEKGKSNTTAAGDNKGKPLPKKEERMMADDPLDSYMDSIKKKIIVEQNKKAGQLGNKGGPKSNDDSEEEVLKAMEQEGLKNYDFIDSEGELDYEALRNVKKQKIEELPALDHSQIKYESFRRDFYVEHSEIKELDAERVSQIRKDLEVRVEGKNVPKPIVSFAHLSFPEKLMAKIRKQEFEKPTPIQSQALPCVLSGKDVIGIAKTGSGKTLAYVWPMLIHIIDQRALAKNDGPIGLILCPTRELSQQVYLETKKFAKVFSLKVAALLGGENKHEQWKELKAGVDIVIATPGRLIDMIKKKATNMKRCTYLVLDEADKMFSMGFEPQIRSIVGQIRPDRQTLLFSATFKKKIQNLCKDILNDPIKINVGKELQSNENVRQDIVTFDKDEEKLQWLGLNIGDFTREGKVLIFANQISTCEELSKMLLKNYGLKCLLLHGDKLQQERTQIVNDFRMNPEYKIMIATDVASRGLDIPEILYVINYDVPKDIETHIHRVGRTGRAGREGFAYTLLFQYETKFASQLAKNFEASGQPVPLALEEIAAEDADYKNQKMMKVHGLDKETEASKMLKKALAAGQRDLKGIGYKGEKQTKKGTKDPQESRFQGLSNTAPTMSFIPASNTPATNPLYANFSMQSKPEMGVNTRESREAILSEYSNRMKSNMQVQFRRGFVSGGTINATANVPSVNFGNNQPYRYEPEVPERQTVTQSDNTGPAPKRRSRFTDAPDEYQPVQADPYKRVKKIDDFDDEL